jgi:hypothetical protein
MKQLPIPQGFCGLWGGTFATVDSYLKPLGFELADGGVSYNDSGYTKPNLLSDAFLKSVVNAGDAPTGVVAGSSHNHTIVNHDHTTGQSDNNQNANHGLNPSFPNTSGLHTHYMNGNTDTLGTDATLPYYTTGIPVVYCMKAGTGSRAIVTLNDIKASGMLDLKLIGIWHSPNAVPGGFAECSGQTVNGLGTIDLRGYYVRGSYNPGGIGGADTHVHNLSHYHTIVATTTAPYDTNGGALYAPLTTHGHAASTTSTADSSAGSNELTHQKSRFITFVGYGASRADHPYACLTDGDMASNLMVPRGLTLLWGHANGEVPTSKWSHCDGGAFSRGAPAGYGNKPGWIDRFVRFTSGGANGGAQAGTDGAHTHSGGGHGHSTGYASDLVAGSLNPSGWESNLLHTHPVNAATWTSQTTGYVMPRYKYVAMLVRD